MANIKMKTLTVGKDVFEIVDEQAREDIKELQENGVKTSVKSVNGKTGVVTLNASDVGALSASDIVDGLTSKESNKALSARSGFQLNSNLTTLRNEFNNLEGDGTIEVDMEEGTFSHKDSGVAASWYGEQGGGDLSFGGSFTVPGALNIDAKGHITEAKDNQFKLPDNEATETKKGLLSPTDKAKLNKLKPPFNFEIGANTASNVDVNVTLFDSDDGEVARFGVVGTGRATVSENSAGALRINVADQDLSAYAKNTDVDTKIATVEKKIPTVAQDIGDSTTATMSQEVISRKLYEIRNTDIEQTERIDSLSEEKVNLPKSSSGAILFGLVGQVAVSDGKGGITWVDVKELIGTNVPTVDIPAYHYAEASRVANNISNFKENCSNYLIFGVVTDNHVYANDATYEEASKNSILYGAFALETVGKTVGSDFNANLGDNCWENGSHTDNAYEGSMFVKDTLSKVFSQFDGFSLVGNHDKNDNTDTIFELIGSDNSFDDYGLTQKRCYGYKDYTSKKVRVICLNTVDYLNGSGGHGMSYEQKDWLMRALDLSSKANASEWQILILSHIPIDFNGGDYNIYADLQTIFNAYVNGTTATITVNSAYALNETPSTYPTYSGGKLVYNYAGKNSAKIIANIHGHVHTNAYGRMATTDIVRMATPNTCFYLNKTESYPDKGDYSIDSTEATKLAKVAGTAKDTAVTFYCIDLDSQVIHAYGYGANTDRYISYATIEVPMYTVTNNLTNVTSSNMVTVIEADAKYTTTLTANSGYEMKSVKVTMGGTDITASRYADGVLSIPSVTGNIVITAVAEIELPYENLFDASAIQVNTRFSSSGVITAGNFWCMETFIPVSTGDIIRIQIPSDNWSNHVQRVIATYTSAAESAHVGKDLYVSDCTVSSDGRLLTGTVPSGVTHIRISGLPASNYAGTIITKNEEIV